MSSATLDQVRRWEASGGIWRVVARRDHSVTLSLVTCTGDEEMDRLRSDDPALLAYVDGRESSEQERA